MGNPNQFDWGGEDLVVKSITFSDTPGGTQTALSSGEVSVLDGVTAGTATASKALVLDSSKGIATITSATITTLTSTTANVTTANQTTDNATTQNAGASGTAGTIQVFPTTASKGKTTITASDNTGNTTTNINTAAQAGAVTYTIPDAGASASFVMTAGAQTIGGTKTLSGGLITAAGTTSLSPITLTAGTNLTTPAAGAMEYDGKVFYMDFAASQRGLNDVEQFIYLTSPYTLASQTTVQKLFNAPTNGALTVLGTTTYMFECMLGITSMSATSGNFKFDLLGAGTATLSASAWHAVGQDAATPGTAGTISGSYTTGTTTSVSSGDIITATTATVAYVHIRGAVRVNATGTLIPSILLTTAAAAVVGSDSYFRCWPIGAATVQSVGNWA